jgi:hypothetical protein
MKRRDVGNSWAGSPHCTNVSLLIWIFQARHSALGQNLTFGFSRCAPILAVHASSEASPQDVHSRLIRSGSPFERIMWSTCQPARKHLNAFAILLRPARELWGC